MASVPSGSPMGCKPDWYADCVPLPIPPTSSGRAKSEYLICDRLAASAAACISVDHWSPQRFSGLPGSTRRAMPGAVAILVRTRNASPSLFSLMSSIFQLGKNSDEFRIPPLTVWLRGTSSVTAKICTPFGTLPDAVPTSSVHQSSRSSLTSSNVAVDFLQTSCRFDR